jgi:hypothetical protein
MDQWFVLLKARFPGRQRGKEWTAIVCPYCGNDRNNFEVNPEKMVFSCWACGCSGSVRQLFYDFGLPVDLVPKGRGQKIFVEPEIEVTLPKRVFDPLSDDAPLSNWALQFLTKRGLTRDDIVKYELKYSLSGRYFGRVIWPLREKDRLVYFAARKFMSCNGVKYIYPKARKRNLCPLVLGREKRMTLVLVEGVLQIPNLVRLGYSVMPLLGTGMSNEQMRQLRKKNFERYVLLLDHDAVLKSINLAMEIRKEQMYSLWADTGGPDSDEMPDDKLVEVVESAKEPSLSTSVSLRLSRVFQ